MRIDANVEYALLTFVRTVQETLQDAGLHHLSRTIVLPHDLETRRLTLWFGDGYFDKRKVYVELDNHAEGEFNAEEAVAAYCEGRLPREE